MYMQSYLHVVAAQVIFMLKYVEKQLCTYRIYTKKATIPTLLHINTTILPFTSLKHYQYTARTSFALILKRSG